MLKMLSLALMLATITGCSYFQIHKLGVEQGNIISQENVSRIHKGMSKSQVEEILGTPLLVNLFAPHRVEYVYTMQEGHSERATTRLSCIFANGRLIEISRLSLS